MHKSFDGYERDEGGGGVGTGGLGGWVGIGGSAALQDPLGGSIKVLIRT